MHSEGLKTEKEKAIYCRDTISSKGEYSFIQIKLAKDKNTQMSLSKEQIAQRIAQEVQDKTICEFRYWNSYAGGELHSRWNRC